MKKKRKQTVSKCNRFDCRYNRLLCTNIKTEWACHYCLDTGTPIHQGSENTYGYKCKHFEKSPERYNIGYEIMKRKRFGMGKKEVELMEELDYIENISNIKIEREDEEGDY